METAREVEELGASKGFLLKTLFECFLGVFDVLGLVEKIHVCQNPHHFREPVNLKNVQHFKRFLFVSVCVPTLYEARCLLNCAGKQCFERMANHLKPKVTVDCQQNNVCNFSV